MGNLQTDRLSVVIPIFLPAVSLGPDYREQRWAPPCGVSGNFTVRLVGQIPKYAIDAQLIARIKGFERLHKYRIERFWVLVTHF